MNTEAFVGAPGFKKARIQSTNCYWLLSC